MGINFWILTVAIPSLLLVSGAIVTYFLSVKGEKWKHRNKGYLFLLFIAVGSTVMFGVSSYQNEDKSNTIDSLRQNQMDTTKLTFQNGIQMLAKQKIALELGIENLDSISKVLQGQSALLSRQLDATSKIEKVLGAIDPPTLSINAHIFTDKLFHKDKRISALRSELFRQGMSTHIIDTTNIFSDTFKIKGYILVNLNNLDSIHPMRNVRVSVRSPNYNRPIKDRREKFVDLYESSFAGYGEIKKTRDLFTIFPSGSARAFEMRVNFDYSGYEINFFVEWENGVYSCQLILHNTNSDLYKNKLIMRGCNCYQFGKPVKIETFYYLHNYLQQMETYVPRDYVVEGALVN